MDPTAKKHFEIFLGARKVLVADSSKTARSALAKALIQLQVGTHNISMVGHYDQAAHEIENLRPAIVISEYMLGRRCGIELASLLREIQPDPMQAIFIVMTKNVKESAVSEAAEENVDRFIVKPFTTEQFQDFIIQAASAKIDPSHYQLSLMEGRKALQSDALYEAANHFREARKVHSKPCLALFYLGQTHSKKGEPEMAERMYRKGLTYNNIHYRCLTGLFDLYSGQQRQDEAYEIIKKISDHFPLSPQRLSSAINLAVRTENFLDLDHYYELFTYLEERRDGIIQVVSAALITAGIYYLQRKVYPRANVCLSRAIIASKHAKNVLYSSITRCLEYERFEDAATFLEQFEPKDHKSPEYRTCKYLVVDQIHPSTENFEMGRKIIIDDIHDLHVYKLQVSRAYDQDLMEWCERLCVEGKKRWRKESAYFQEFLDADE